MDIIDGILNVKDLNGETPFYKACFLGQLDIAKKLYDLCNNVIKHADNAARTPFYIACFNGRTEIVKWLLGIDKSLMHIANNNKCTPFLAACFNGHLEIAQMLYEIDPAIINIPNNLNVVPFFIACFNGHLNIVEWLIDLIDINTINALAYNNFKIATITCYAGHLDVLQFLYSKNPSCIIDQLTKLKDMAYRDNRANILKWLNTINPSKPLKSNEITVPKFVDHSNCWADIKEIFYNVTKYMDWTKEHSKQL